LQDGFKNVFLASDIRFLEPLSFIMYASIYPEGRRAFPHFPSILTEKKSRGFSSASSSVRINLSNRSRTVCNMGASLVTKTHRNSRSSQRIECMVSACYCFPSLFIVLCSLAFTDFGQFCESPRISKITCEVAKCLELSAKGEVPKDIIRNI